MKICRRMFTAPPPPVFVLHARSTVFYTLVSFFSAYSLCASGTLGSLRAWQSPTA